MLNEYHLQFLGLFNKRTVRSIVIGGQARFIHHGVATRDLDIWVDISPVNRLALDQCLMDWSSEHPLHTMPPLSFPLRWEEKRQIKFPDADVMYMRRNGEPAEIAVADGIDVLTSIGDADFGAFFDRATSKTVDGLDILFLAAQDLDVISPAK